MYDERTVTQFKLDKQGLEHKIENLIKEFCNHYEVTIPSIDVSVVSSIIGQQAITLVSLEVEL